ncbi:hypothetical protein QQ045_031935 [Rhodiola kirilowii]
MLLVKGRHLAGGDLAKRRRVKHCDWLKQLGDSESLGKQQLVDCDHECDPERPGSRDSGCIDGLMNNAFAYTLKSGGLMREEGFYKIFRGQNICGVDLMVDAARCVEMSITRTTKPHFKRKDVVRVMMSGLGSTRLASSSSSPSAPIFHPKRNNQVAGQVRKSEIEMSAVVSSAPWKQLLLRALESNSNLNHSSYFQLATVAPNGRPSNRTVVFRGFEGDSDRIEINTDTRTRKIEELKHCPFAEICWYFTDSWEQFRINGRVDVVDETYPDTSRLQERERSWFASSARSKLQYVGPHPGLPSIGEETPQEANLDPTSGPVSAFCLLVLDPYQVDYLNLKNNQRTSFLSTRSADGQRSWVAENVNP